MRAQDMNEQNTTENAPLQYESPKLEVLGTVASLTQGGIGSYGDTASLGEDSSASGSGKIE
jgi:hypothetical protein